MSVKYNNKYIIPAPLMTVSKTYNKSGDGQNVSSTYDIQVNGTMLSHMGSPNASGVFSTNGTIDDTTWEASGLLGDFIQKQYALRDLFSDPGQEFVVTSLNNQEIMKFYPSINGVSFQAAPWTDRCDYSISMQTNTIYSSGTLDTGFVAEESFDNVESLSESWKYAEGEQDDIFVISHTINAKGLLVYTNGTIVTQPWRYAQQACSGAMQFATLQASTGSFDSTIPILAATGYHYNLALSEDVNEKEGTCSITEDWTFKPASTPYIERYTINSKESSATTINKMVSMEGSITGLADRQGDFNARYAVASGVLSDVISLIPTRITSHTGYGDLKTWPTTKSITYMPYAGQIAYSVEYEAGPLPTTSGALVEEISVSDTGRTDVFASIVVPGRYIGPVHQNMNTFNAPTRSVQVSCIMGSGWQEGKTTFRDKYLNKPNVLPILSGCEPEGTYFKTSDNESWEPNTYRYSRNVTWTLDTPYQSGVPSGYGYADIY